MRPGHLFYYRLVLKPEMDSNLIWIGPPTWLGRPYFTPKVVTKEEDVLGHLLGVLHLLGACSNLALSLSVNNKPATMPWHPTENSGRMSR
jgi:hypothetical protein